MPLQTISADLLRKRFAAFLPNAEFLGAEECHGGHINRTFFVDAAVYGQKRRFVLQSVNKNVFKNYAGVMENVFRISAHLGQKSLDVGSDDPTRDHIHFIRTADGGMGVDGTVGFWRLYRYIGGAEGRRTFRLRACGRRFLHSTTPASGSPISKRPPETTRLGVSPRSDATSRPFSSSVPRR